jgi:hypothetical protein
MPDSEYCPPPSLGVSRPLWSVSFEARAETPAADGFPVRKPNLNIKLSHCMTWLS